MKEKILGWLNSRPSWLMIGTVIAATVGEPWTTVVKFVGEAVMAGIPG